MLAASPNTLGYDPPPDILVDNKLVPYIHRNPPMLHNYTRYARIGHGHHGEVFLCFRIEARFAMNDVRRWFPVAMKSVKRDTLTDKYTRLKANRVALTNQGPSEPAVADKLSTTELKIKKEIAIMKKLCHPNVVRLFEVIDDRQKEKVYMVMEYLGGGEIKWRTENEEPTLTIAQSRRIMRDAILGLEYLHHQGIIHRDIKPANLLWTEDRHHVKIADFGVSHFSYAQRLAEAGEEWINQDGLDEILMDESDLTKRAGTPAFLAPELIFEHFEEKNKHFVVSSLVPKFSSKQPAKPSITKAIDIWALGVTLYCLLFGRTPFLNVTEGGATEFALYRAICNKDWDAPEFMCKGKVPTGGRHPKKSSKYKHTEGAKVINLLERFLQKDQTKRITLDEVKRHVWITQDLLNPNEWCALTSPARGERVEVTKSDMFMAVSSVHFRWGLGGFGKGMSALFRPLKVRSQTSPTLPASGSSRTTQSVGAKPDPHAGGRLVHGKTPAVAGVQGVHVYTRSVGKVDKGKGKAVEPVASQSIGPSTMPSSVAVDAIRRQRSEMGILGHERRHGESSTAVPPSQQQHQTSAPAPRLEDIMSIVTWRPTKYPTPTTSLTPLLANVHADGKSTFRSSTKTSSRSRNPLPSSHIRAAISPGMGGPMRTVSTLEGVLRSPGDLLGIYGPEGELTEPTAATLNHFKRASSWGQGDEALIDGVGMGVGGDIVSVTSVGAELNETVKLVGAGGVETHGSPVSPLSPSSPEESIGLWRGGRSVSAGSAGEGPLGGRSRGASTPGGITGSAGGSAGGSGSGGANPNAGTNWEELERGIKNWRDYRKKHHHQRNASSSTLPWVESLEDVTFTGETNTNGKGSTSDSGVGWERNRDENKDGHGRKQGSLESKGALTIEWIDDNYSTPGGYYGCSMGPATQFWRHGRGAWNGSSATSPSSSEDEDRPMTGPSRVARSSHKEVMRPRDVSLDKLWGREGSASDTDEGGAHGEGGSDYGSVGVEKRSSGEPEAVGVCEGDEMSESEDECDSEDEDEDDGDDHVQPILFKSRGKTPVSQ